MKRLIIWLPAVAILCVAIAAASSCSTTPATACNLNAPSATAAGPACEAKWIDANVAINQLQSFGTHNSYKEKIPDVEMALINERLPKVGPTLDYSHRPFAEQLDKGARQIELDPSDDPQGGLYSTPLARKILTERGVALPAYDLSVMAKPGIKVIHVADIDYRSHCLLFVDCLKQIKAWSDAHPNHTPILMMINPKSSGIPWVGAVKVLPWQTTQLATPPGRVGRASLWKACRNERNSTVWPSGPTPELVYFALSSEPDAPWHWMQLDVMFTWFIVAML